jgi:hypothetical protein
MRVLIILALVCIAAPSMLAQKETDTELLELQGDKLGESLSSFVAQHPKAQCANLSSKRKNCYQWEDVSIFGLVAHAESTCSPANHASPGCVQGLSAQFVDERLVLLTYAVGGSDKRDATTALKKKYGAPDIDTPEASIWSKGRGTLSVVVGKATDESNAETLVTFMIQG